LHILSLKSFSDFAFYVSAGLLALHPANIFARQKSWGEGFDDAKVMK